MNESAGSGVDLDSPAAQRDLQHRAGHPAEQPIAIIGMACRFPGADDLGAFWRLLEAGGNAVREGVPGSGVGRVGELFGDAVDAAACRFGAFLDGIDQFDAPFFRISPIEADLLDPQQRLMLETSWRAVEDAGIDADRLKGTRTGVYAGISNNEYRGLVAEAIETSEPAAGLYSVTGTSFNTAIGRVAYALGLQGPAIALDTACSSSLVAVHQAAVGLQRGEADLALAGGVHAILSGRLFEMRAIAGMLSPNGRCATFDAAADGYVRGEGCGILVLKRLDEAESDGDRIWGVIRGSALNQDGASAGLTVPNGEAQELVIAEALRRAGVTPAEIDYLEAHGTGTPVGDPIELRAVANAFGPDRAPGRPLLIGSVKTNMGHLEAAAGVAGLIKVALAMHRGVIPRHRNFETPSPEIDWETLPLRVTSEATAWPRADDRAPLAGVSGFGWSGTNAHVVVEGYGAAGNGTGWPAGSPRPVAVRVPAGGGEAASRDGCAGRTERLLALSGRSPAALRDLAGRYLAWLDEHAGELEPDGVGVDGLLADMAWTAAVGRSHQPHRAGVTFSDIDSLRDGLAALAAAGDVATRPGRRPAFVFTGQASQWVGMGEALYDCEPVVRAVLDECDREMQQRRGVSLLDVMFGRSGAGHLDDPAWTQPAIYSLECALAALWASLGVRPDVVLGHSLGEIAAAQAAGALTLIDGLRFAAARGELMGALGTDGAMAAVYAPAERVAAAVAEHNATITGPGLSIAADNGAQQVISGPARSVRTLAARFESEGLWATVLPPSPAYHSALVEPALDALEAVTAGLDVSAPSCGFLSSMTGALTDSAEPLDGSYWRRQARAPVAFRAAVETLAELGTDVVVEIGPHAVLGPMVLMCWPDGGPAAPLSLASLRRPASGMPADPEVGSGFLGAVAQLYESGATMALEGLFAGESRRRISLPGYPFEHSRHWVAGVRRRRSAGDHPLLGARHESPRGETMFAGEISVADPAWLGDHRVFGRVLAPGSLFAAMAAAAVGSGGDGTIVVEDLQLRSPLMLPDGRSEDDPEQPSRSLQLILAEADGSPGRRFEIFSRATGTEGWTIHAEGRAGVGAAPAERTRIDPDALTAGLVAEDPTAFYRSKAEDGVRLGPSFRTLEALWSGDGEAAGEVVLPESVDRRGADVHPVLLDGCLQVVATARKRAELEDDGAYLVFGCDRFWLAGAMPDRVFCHASLRRPAEAATSGDGPLEVISGDLRIYAADGVEIGGLSGYTVKRATRAALLSATEGVRDLLYEVVWRDRELPEAMPPADFLPGPAAVAADAEPFSEYLATEGVDAGGRAALLGDLERLAWSYALATLEGMGWERRAGETLDPEALRRRFGVAEEHRRVFRRMFELLAAAGVVESLGNGFRVLIGGEDSLPAELPVDPEQFADRMAAQYPHGSNEVGLFRRSAGALADVLVGRADPLTLLFSSGEPTAADLYRKAPVARAANGMLRDAVARLLGALPAERRLRVLEVGAGTGSATAAVLPELPEGRFDYVYTDISAGFFAEAEAQFGGAEAGIDYRVLDIEVDPITQGFDRHGYDLLIASNVLHATRRLPETLAHCRAVLAPSGQLVALENLRGQGWLDLTFGQLDGWWRFADDYRPRHALAGPAVWCRALADAGFAGAEVLGLETADATAAPDRGVIIAAGPAEVTEPPGFWVIAADRSGVAEGLAAELAARNQTVVLAGAGSAGSASASTPGVSWRQVEPERRDSWRDLMEALPADVPLCGVVHLMGVDGAGVDATTEELAGDTRRAAGSALALLQGLADVDATPSGGVWFVTRGAQVLEKERTGELAGAALWGVGKVVAREAAHLQPRMIDLDPAAEAPVSELAGELLHPDAETHVAYRYGRRRAARLVRAGTEAGRLSLPEESGWLMEPDEGGALENLQVVPLPERPLQANEVRVAIEATGLNFWDLFRALAVIDEGLLGGEFCGRVLEVGSDVSDVSDVSVGDLVVGLAFGTFASEVVTQAEMVARAPAGFPPAALATIPTAFTSAQLSYDLSGLRAGERVLIHAGAGGVGLAAIQLAQAAGAEVFATAGAPKQAYLRSLGVQHVFDSRRTRFGEQILEATGGEGVDVVLNSLTGEGFIDAGLSCLARGGRFVELARVGILSPEEMAAARPDVAYSILELDVLKEQRQAVAGDALRRVMAMLAAGEVTPLTHTRWSPAELEGAIKFMQAARHIGKIVLVASPLGSGRLRGDRTYLVTGGLGGIGCVLAGWLADRGAGAIVLNGRRDPDPEAAEAIEALRERGVTVAVEPADVTDAAALDAMLARIDATLPPLGGVIHSVGVLSDGALTNQTWEKFADVLWPKMLGAWHLHRATADRDLDLFVLFSSVAGVLGNAGQANHSAANAFLDQLAAHRRSLGLAGQSIAWGAWSGLGEAEEQRERIARQLEAQGTGWIAPAQGLRALEYLMRQDLAAGMVAAVDWQVFAENHEQRSPLLEDLLEVPGDGSEVAKDSEVDPLAGISEAAPAERRQMLVSFLQRQLQAVMRLSTAPAPSVEFSDLGMDSLMAVELRNRLNRGLAGQYVAPNTVVFDYPSVASLAGHLATELGEGVASDAVPVPAAPRAPLPTGEATIAIVGMACRFPGADDLEGFWRQLEAGEDAITDGRRDAGPWRGVAGDPANESGIERLGAFVDGIDRFDAAFFRIQPIEAKAMDPQQRLLLETSWLAIEDAGIDPEQLKGSRTGVYAGVGGSEYRRLITAAGRDDNYLGTAGSMAVGRVAFALGLEGPAVPVDLACASSLVALHQAVVGLQRNEVDLALAGGVNTVLSPAVARFLSDYGMLSRSGRCAAFDATADGYVRGEGCGLVVLKRLSEATADGDRIWGLVRGIAVNQNGAGLGITVPNGRAQERVMAEALARAGVAPGDVDYLEAHGPATQMGDPIEVRAVANVYGQARQPERPLLMGSVKTNVGHLESAAGAAGLIKAVLAMNRGVIPAHLHFREPTPEIDWEQLPLRVTSEPTAWPSVPDRPPLAGINVFGISGANAHAVIEGYRTSSDSSASANGLRWPAGAPRQVLLPEGTEDGSVGEPRRARRLLPLSAKTPEALAELARRYLEWLDAPGGDEAGTAASATDSVLADMAWTASVGRSHFEHRAGIVFDDDGSLRRGLVAVADGGPAPAHGLLDPDGVRPEDGDDLLAAAEAYEAGHEVRFERLYAGESRRRISLPGYPFQRRRHWIEAAKQRTPNTAD
jgi:acyl transferase domain-containing protein/NADPH:quinone reductase-like Zn-dependent oxidoreductase/NADP-dependent 3-hydroxy acid dehydrogenase YdfG